MLGLYLSHHPLSDYETILSENTIPILQINNDLDGETVKIGGLVASVREITTKNGAKMAFCKIEDISGDIEMVVFPTSFQKDPTIWQRDNIIIATGRVSCDNKDFSDNSEFKLLVESARVITSEDAQAYKPSGKKEIINLAKVKKSPRRPQDVTKGITRRLYIRMEKSDNQPQLIDLKQKLDNFSGDTEVVLVAGPGESKQIIKLPQTISISEESLRAIAGIFGSTNVIVR